ncbi:PspC domain-containing protein [Corynebacterium pseudopelargi]|uniref:DNA-binding transcriptional activator PspC n=1 Tax=Corynebacterium pseudopelargi TaxID=2080757 RepID=A0A3G6IV55_9CORY|nr:PspC domain-containing protein [Corynebacterium pseudopelargi]AZA09506.1 DNA-binding transcriptional activator PspC [Corynebacterium pseudopelargi]
MAEPFWQRKLYRSTDHKLIGGVLGGVSETYGIDVTLLRVLTVVSIILPGPQVLAYLVAWLIMPKRP